MRLKISQQKTPLEKINEPLEISISSEKANKPFVDKGDKPPYAGLRAQDITLKQETVFVRVHGTPGTASKAQGRWVMRKKGIEGLTAADD